LYLMVRLRQRGNEEDALNRIQDAFDALYEGTCPNDDQKDFTGQRYIYANDFRLLLTEIGDLHVIGRGVYAAVPHIRIRKYSIPL
jgi:hypothetical protein